MDMTFTIMISARVWEWSFILVGLKISRSTCFRFGGPFNLIDTSTVMKILASNNSRVQYLHWMSLSLNTVTDLVRNCRYTYSTRAPVLNINTLPEYEQPLQRIACEGVGVPSYATFCKGCAYLGKAAHIWDGCLYDTMENLSTETAVI